MGADRERLAELGLRGTTTMLSRYLLLLAGAASAAAYSFAGVGAPALRVRSEAAVSRKPLRALAALNMVSDDAGKEKLKQFLEEAKGLGKVRLIAQNDASVMESIATLDGLFYATGGPKQLEYANVIDPKINLDLHLLLDGVGGARLETGVSRTPTRDPTYIVRMTGNDPEKVVLSIFLQWDKEPSDVSQERVDAWKAMKEKYGDTVSF